MKEDPVLAVVGATGLVGTEMIAVIDQLKLKHGGVRLLASQDSAGEIYKVGDQEVEIEELRTASFEGVDVALFATSAEISAEFAPAAVRAGAYVIDNSRQFRMDPEVPLVVPEVNADAISATSKLISNPNCSTIQLVPVLKVLHELGGLKRVVVSTYQSVSGAGKDALDELWEQTISIFNQKDFTPEAFQHQIAFNCIPQIDVFLEDGFTREEHKIMQETRKILGLPNLKITATAVRVPVLYSHAESVSVDLERPVSVSEAIAGLTRVKGIEVYPEFDNYPMQLSAATTDAIHVGRIRKDPSVDNGLQLWIVADNVRKGAALNAVQIAEILCARFQA